MIFIPQHIQLGKNRFRLPKLAFTAVDQYDIGDFILFYCLAVTTTQNLVHRRIIISRRDAGDIVAAILRSQRPVAIKNHARRNRLFTHRMADIKAFHPVDGGKLEQCRQRPQALGNRRMLGNFGGQRRRGVSPRQLQVARAIAAGFSLYVNPAPGQFRE